MSQSLKIWKECLNSDGQQLQPYLNKTNNHLSPQLIEQKKTMTYDVGNPDPNGIIYICIYKQTIKKNLHTLAFIQ